MERVPAHLSYDAIGRALARLPGVTGVHDLHVWTMTADRPALSAHLMLADGDQWPAILAAARALLAREFGIDHVTLQPAWPVQPGPRQGRADRGEARGRVTAGAAGWRLPATRPAACRQIQPAFLNFQYRKASMPTMRPMAHG